MRRCHAILATLAAAMVLAAPSAVPAQCPGGVCPIPQALPIYQPATFYPHVPVVVYQPWQPTAYPVVSPLAGTCVPAGQPTGYYLPTCPAPVHAPGVVSYPLAPVWHAVPIPTVTYSTFPACANGRCR